jgi:hypothetical protein
MASFASFGAVTAQAATQISYDFGFTIIISNDARYTVGEVGTGHFSFYGQSESQGTTIVPGINAIYTTQPFSLSITYRGIDTTLFQTQGFPGNLNNLNDGIIIQDIPSNQVTYDLFRIGGANSRLSVFAPAPTIGTYDLTASNVDALWGGRIVGSSSIEIVNNFVHARLTSFNQVSAIPELETWALMVVGFGGAGTAIRRARKRILSLER